MVDFLKPDMMSRILTFLLFIYVGVTVLLSLPLLKDFILFTFIPSLDGAVVDEKIDIAFGSIRVMFWLPLFLLVAQIIYRRKRFLSDLADMVPLGPAYVLVWPTALFGFLRFGPKPPLAWLTYFFGPVVESGYDLHPVMATRFFMQYVINSTIFLLLIVAIYTIYKIYESKGERSIDNFISKQFIFDVLLLYLPFWYLVKGYFYSTFILQGEVLY